MDYDIKEEMGSDLWELEMLSVSQSDESSHSTKTASNSTPSTAASAASNKPAKADAEGKAAPKSSNGASETDTFNKCKAYYGTKEEIGKALSRLYTRITDEPEMAEKLGRVRDFYLLSLAYVTTGGALTSLDGGMIPILQKYAKKANKLGVTTDIEAWKKVFDEIAQRLATGENIDGLGKKVYA